MTPKSLLQKILSLRPILVTGLVAFILIIVFSIGPAVVAKYANPVGNQELPPVSPAAQTLHEALTIADLHADSLLWGRNLLERSDYGHVDIPRLLQGNVALQVFSSVTKTPVCPKQQGNRYFLDSVLLLAILQRWPIRTWFSLAERSIYQAQQLHALEEEAPDTFKIIKTQQDLRDFLAQTATDRSRTAGLLGIEGAQAFEGNIDNIDRLYEVGFRIIGLSHFFDNEVAGSAHGVSKDGLTPFGRDAIKRMAELNMMIDLSHASPQTIDDVLQLTKRPILVSHTGVQTLCEGVRNLSDRQLQQIATAGGVIGIGFFDAAVCDDDIGATVKAIRYVADRVGVDHVALGSDFDGAVQVPFDVSYMVQMTQALLKADFTESEIQKIMGLNVVHLLQQYLPA